MKTKKAPFNKNDRSPKRHLGCCPVARHKERKELVLDVASSVLQDGIFLDTKSPLKPKKQRNQHSTTYYYILAISYYGFYKYLLPPCCYCYYYCCCYYPCYCCWVLRTRYLVLGTCYLPCYYFHYCCHY